MSERLDHLRRQQALLREHLAWIEAEIARETPSDPRLRPQRDPTTSSSVAPLAPAAHPAELPQPEFNAIVEQYAAEERQRPEDIRRGCFLVFGGALLVLILTVATIWLVFYR